MYAVTLPATLLGVVSVIFSLGLNVSSLTSPAITEEENHNERTFDRSFKRVYLRVPAVTLLRCAIDVWTGLHPAEQNAPRPPAPHDASGCLP